MKWETLIFSNFFLLHFCAKTLICVNQTAVIQALTYLGYLFQVSDITPSQVLVAPSETASWPPWFWPIPSTWNVEQIISFIRKLKPAVVLQKCKTNAKTLATSDCLWHRWSFVKNFSLKWPNLTREEGLWLRRCVIFKLCPSVVSLLLCLRVVDWSQVSVFWNAWYNLKKMFRNLV